MWELLREICSIVLLCVTLSVAACKRRTASSNNVEKGLRKHRVYEVTWSNDRAVALQMFSVFQCSKKAVSLREAESKSGFPGALDLCVQLRSTKLKVDTISHSFDFPRLRSQLFACSCRMICRLGGKISSVAFLISEEADNAKMQFVMKTYTGHTTQHERGQQGRMGRYRRSASNL